MGFGIYYDLTKAGWLVLVVNPADILRGNKQTTTKTDRVDSAYLAKQLASGHLKGIYVPITNRNSSAVCSAAETTWSKI